MPSRWPKAATISVTVGSVSNRSQSRTWLAVNTCQSATAAATEAMRTSQAVQRRRWSWRLAGGAAVGDGDRGRVGGQHRGRGGHTAPASACW